MSLRPSYYDEMLSSPNDQQLPSPTFGDYLVITAMLAILLTFVVLLFQAAAPSHNIKPKSQPAISATSIVRSPDAQTAR